MRFDLSAILLLVGVVLFLLAAFSITLGTLALVPLGLAAFAASFLFKRGGFSLRG
jgi:membrane-bound ClpP family serine protease